MVVVGVEQGRFVGVVSGGDSGGGQVTRSRVKVSSLSYSYMLPQKVTQRPLQVTKVLVR